MTSVKLSPALFHKVSNELNTEAEMLSKKKEGLLYSMSGEYSKVEELKLLMQFTAKKTTWLQNLRRNYSLPMWIG